MLDIYGGEGQSLVIEEMAFGLGTAEPEPAPSGDRGVGQNLAALKEVARQQGQPSLSGPPRGSSGTGETERDLVERVAAELARALVAVIRDLLKPTGGGQTLEPRVERQEEALKTAVEGLIEMKGRVEKLHEQVAAASASQQKADKQRETELANVRQETTNLSSSMADRIQALVSRLEIQEQEISEVKIAVSDITPRVAAVAERLERQAQALRSVCQAYSEPQSAVDRLIDTLVQWKSSAVLVPAADQATL